MSEPALVTGLGDAGTAPKIEGVKRDARGRILPGQITRADPQSVWFRRKMTRSERQWMANIRLRLEQAGMGSRRWCQLRARRALSCRRIVSWSNDLCLAEHAQHASMIFAAFDFLERVEQDCGGRKAKAKDPLATERGAATMRDFEGLDRPDAEANATED